MRPSLRVRYHRGTTAHVASIYPFSVQASAGYRGVYVGLDLLAGGAEFCWDPFEAYAAGAVTNPNCWIFGEPGKGKSSLVKCLLWRMAAIYGAGGNGRWFALADPKGEYRDLAERLGLNVVRLTPGGATRVNPLDDGPASADEPSEQRTLRRAEMVAALGASVLDRPLTQLEDAALFAAVEQLGQRRQPPTLIDLVRLLTRPDDEMAQRLRRTAGELSDDLAPITFAIDKLLTRSLRGMFDGPSTVPLRWDGPGIVLDLSAVPMDSEALPLVMVAAAGWLSQLMCESGPRRVQVIDEAYVLLANRHTARWLQTCQKLGRSYGVANICVAHKPSDLAAQSDDGTATAKIAAGLVADAATKILLAQAPDQLEAARTTFGLTEPEAHVVSHLTRGRHLWKVGGRTAVVHHMLTKSEGDLCDTDARMAGDPTLQAA